MTNIPVVIYCGGRGTRMHGGTHAKKELVEIGGKPIIWHVMKIFSSHGFNHFVLPLGYGAEQIKRYFLEYEAMTRDFSLAIAQDDDVRPITYYGDVAGHPPWRIDMIETGKDTDKASRLQMVSHYLTESHFFLTYGDGVSDIDLHALVCFHEWHGKKVTISGIQPGRYQYGIIESDLTGAVSEYNQYPPLPYWINAGFMLFDRSVLDTIQPDKKDEALETGILQKLVQQDDVMMYRHLGFWQSMDTYKDTMELEDRWLTDAPWKRW